MSTTPVAKNTPIAAPYTVAPYTPALFDAVDEGLIVIDASGTVEAVNRRAQEITGILQSTSRPHPAGNLRPGDLVIIADNRMGYDDGQLSAKDLASLNIDCPDLEPGEALIAIGLYQDKRLQGVCRHWRNKSGNERLMVQVAFDKRHIEVTIDVVLKIIDIKVDGQLYRMRYTLAIGHLVAFSPGQLEAKFYQARGYTIRRESIAELLRGNPFHAKGTPEANISLVGQRIDSLLESSILLSRIETCLLGEKDYFQNEYHEINKRPSLCTLLPLDDSDKGHLLLKLLDLSNLENLITERNQLIAMLERTVRHFNGSQPNAGHSHAMQKLEFLLKKAGQNRSTVLITGESGTGKSYIAEQIHRMGPSPDQSPFIAVNCTAIPAALFESELFGYSRGAFTGADKAGKKGLFELADGGTLFLDEIGELPLDMQVKLLQALQTKMFYKIGAVTPTKVNVRIIAATNKDLKAEILGRRFREDLYYRINGFPIAVPPLRTRKTDLYSLIQIFLERLAADFGGPPKQLTAEALDCLMHYDWPGNIRELENAIELAFHMSDGPWIQLEDLNIQDSRENIDGLTLAAAGHEASSIIAASNASTASAPLKARLEAYERQLLLEALEAHHYNAKATMHALGITKTIFYEKLKKHQLSPLKGDSAEFRP